MLTFEAKKIEKIRKKMNFFKFPKIVSKCFQKVPNCILSVLWVLNQPKQVLNILRNDFKKFQKIKFSTLEITFSKVIQPQPAAAMKNSVFLPSFEDKTFVRTYFHASPHLLSNVNDHISKFVERIF